MAAFAGLGAGTAAMLMAPMIANFLKKGGKPSKKEMKKLEAAVHNESKGSVKAIKMKPANKAAKRSPGVAMVEKSSVARAAIPASFAAPAMQQGFTSEKSGPDSVKEMLADCVGNVQPQNGWGGCLSFGGANYAELDPGVSGILPNLYSRSYTWSRWRPLGLKLHYLPTQGSTQVGALSIGFIDDSGTADLTTILASLTSVAALGAKQASGALNQAFSTKMICPESWKRSSFLPLGSVEGIDGDLPMSPGYVYCYGQGTGTGTTRVNTGQLYVELYVEFEGVRPLYNGVSLVSRLVHQAALVKTPQGKSIVRKRFLDLVARLKKDIIDRMDAVKQQSVERGISSTELSTQLTNLLA
jgi:hypothetical protein